MDRDNTTPAGPSPENPPHNPSDTSQGTPEGREARERTFLVFVDDTQEYRKALRYAARRAAHTGGRLALLYVLAPAEFQHWMAVADLMREERRAEAEAILQEASSQVLAESGKTPVYYIREGDPREELLDLIRNDSGISILVLGAAQGKKGPGPLVSALSRMAGELPIPVTIVPGNLSDEAIEALT